MLCKTRNVGTWIDEIRKTGGIAEHPGTVTEQQNISGTPRNTNETSLQHQQNTPEQRNHTKRRKIVVFFKENVNLTLIHLTHSTQG